MKIIVVNLVLLAMAVWLLEMANSATSKVCMLIGCVVIVTVHSKFGRRHPGFLKVLIPGSFCLYLILALGFGMSGNLAAMVGKDPTLTDRTKIWAFLFNMHTNPLVGIGYESFWLGPRLQAFWLNAGLGHINEAHDGYLEIYLNLGIIGVLLILGFLVASFRNICKKLKPFDEIAALYSAVWAVMLFYCVTEAGFRSGLLWLTFLLAGVAVSRPVEQREPLAAAFENEPSKARFLKRPLTEMGQRQ